MKADESYLVMRHSEREFVCEASAGELAEARAYCERKNWIAHNGADLVIYKLVEVGKEVDA